MSKCLEEARKNSYSFGSFSPHIRKDFQETNK